jgi:hypothetical protein
VYWTESVNGSLHVVLAKGEEAPAELALGPDSEDVKRIFWTTRGGEVRVVAR